MINKEKIINEILNIDYNKCSEGFLEFVKVEKNAKNCDVGIVFKIEDPAMFIEGWGLPIIKAMFKNSVGYKNEFLKLPQVVKESLLERAFYEMYDCSLETKNDSPSVLSLYNNIKIQYVKEYGNYLSANMNKGFVTGSKIITKNLYILGLRIIDDLVTYV